MRLPRQPLSRPARWLAGRVVVVAALVGITMLGNLRLQASEIGHPLSTRAVGVGVLAAPAVAEPVAAQFTGRHVGPGDASAPSRDDEADAEEVQLVPAIYAWDKDVRFVYFRHMSKWM